MRALILSAVLGVAVLSRPQPKPPAPHTQHTFHRQHDSHDIHGTNR